MRVFSANQMNPNMLSFQMPERKFARFLYLGLYRQRFRLSTFSRSLFHGNFHINCHFLGICGWSPKSHRANIFRNSGHILFSHSKFSGHHVLASCSPTDAFSFRVS